MMSAFCTSAANFSSLCGVAVVSIAACFGNAGCL
jgi:hypothetical protein